MPKEKKKKDKWAAFLNDDEEKQEEQEKQKIEQVEDEEEPEGKASKGKRKEKNKKKGGAKEEEKKAPASLPKDERMPIEVVYCGICGVPPEYCRDVNKNFDPCKEWLIKTHPDLGDKIFPPLEEAKEEEKKQVPKKKGGIKFAEDLELKIKILT